MLTTKNEIPVQRIRIEFATARYLHQLMVSVNRIKLKINVV